MQKRILARYEVYPSVDSLLAVDNLGALLKTSIKHVQLQPYSGYDGMSGNQMQYVVIDTGDERRLRYVLKRMSTTLDWIMLASRDHRFRSVTVWQYGLLDWLLPELNHPIIACSYDENGCAILMNDLSEGLLLGRTPGMSVIRPLLDSLAALHAKFWAASELTNSTLGLCSTATLIEMFSPSLVSQFPNFAGRFPIMISEGWEALETIMERSVFKALELLITNPQPLCDVTASLPSTLVHGDYRIGNSAILPGNRSQTVVFDWQCAGYSLMTIDLAWFCNDLPIYKSGVQMTQIAQYYRAHLTKHLGGRLDQAQWQRMLELGFLVNTLRKACFHAWLAVHLEDGTNKYILRKSIDIYANTVRASLKWL